MIHTKVNSNNIEFCVAGWCWVGNIKNFDRIFKEKEKRKQFWNICGSLQDTGAGKLHKQNMSFLKFRATRPIWENFPLIRICRCIIDRSSSKEGLTIGLVSGVLGVLGSGIMAGVMGMAWWKTDFSWSVSNVIAE